MNAPTLDVPTIYLPGDDLGAKIREHREAAEMTQADLAREAAEQLGRPPFTVHTVANWERNRVLPDPMTLVAIGLVLGVAFVLGGPRMAGRVARNVPLVLDVAATMAGQKAAKQRGKGQKSDDP